MFFSPSFSPLFCLKSAEIKRLRESISHGEIRLRDMQAECNALRKQNVEMRAQIDAEGTQIDSLQQSLENMRDEYELLSPSLSSL